MRSRSHLNKQGQTFVSLLQGVTERGGGGETEGERGREERKKRAYTCASRIVQSSTHTVQILLVGLFL